MMEKDEQIEKLKKELEKVEPMHIKVVVYGIL